MKNNKAFTLIETLIAMVIGVISVAAISYSYIYFNSTYQNIIDKANMSQSGRSSLRLISKDLRNAGYKNISWFLVLLPFILMFVLIGLMFIVK